MHIQKISFEATQSFTPFFLDYIRQKESLKPFYHCFPSIENFANQIKEKSASYSKQNRETLVESLNRQYKNYDLHVALKNNLELLKSENTFTITTGHQLNIFTGPLYFIYKIITVINTCKKLKEAYPTYNFVPVYWMASEDHDYDEIKSFRLYNKKYTWETGQKGAVGRFDTRDLKNLLDQIPGDVKIFKDAYTEHKKLSDAVRSYINTLFGAEGLIVIDGDDRELKKILIPAIEDDLFRHSPKHQVDTADKVLEDAGYKTQVHCREINFFYLDDGLRSRIEKSGNRFTVVDTPISFAEEEIKTLIHENPEKFSPNVILRPIYQEMILPNLAYIGGPAEVVYWLQFKGIFDHHGITFPMLMPRNFALVLDSPTARKFTKTGLEIEDLFMDKHNLFNKAVLKFSKNSLMLNGEKDAIITQFKIIQENALAIDKTLSTLVDAEKQRAINSLEKIEQKLLKAEKRKHSDRLKQIEAVKDVLFPNGSLQERTDNFLNFYQHDPTFIQSLLKIFDPFDFRFNVLRYP